MQSRNDTMSAGVLRPFGAALREEGLDLEGVLEEAQIPPSVYRQPRARVSYAAGARFLKAAMARTTKPALGLRAARHLDAGRFQELEYLGSSSTNVSTALDGFVKQQWVFADSPFLRLEQHERGRLLRYHPGFDPPRCLSEYVVGGIALASWRALGLVRKPRVVPVEVWFSYSVSRREATAYEQLFLGNLVFEAPATGLLFLPESLKQPMTQANPPLQALLEEDLDRARETMADEVTLVDRVEALLLANLAGSPIGLGDAARQLHMSRSTLKRRLAEEDESYSTLLDRVRQRTATQLLTESRISVGEVAHRAGYSGLPTFDRAFRRWTGKSPSHYRRNQQ